MSFEMVKKDEEDYRCNYGCTFRVKGVATLEEVFEAMYEYRGEFNANRGGQIIRLCCAVSRGKLLRGILVLYELGRVHMYTIR